MSFLSKVLFVFSVSLFSSVCTASGNSIEAVHALLDRVEEAYDQHAIDLLGQQYSEEGFLIIRHIPQGTFVFNRTETLETIGRRWQRIKTHRFVERDIQLTGDLAFLRLRIADRMVNQKFGTSEFFAAAVWRNGRWKMCFGMDAFLRPGVVVSGFIEGSAAQKAGVQAGDLIVSYDGQNIQTIEKLQALTGSTSNTDSVLFSVLRDNRPVPLQLSGGLPGVRCEQRILPEGHAVFFGEGQEHPIKELMQEELRGFMTGDVKRASAMIHPTHFLAMMPGPRQDTVLVSKEAVPDVYQDGLSTLREIYDLSTAQYLNMRVIESGDVAVASNRFAVEKRDPPGEKISYPSVLEVFVRQQDQWYLVAILPLRMELGAALQRPAAISLSREQTRDLQKNLKGERSGIGVEIEKHPEGIELRNVFEGGAAERAGLHRGEIILAVDEKPAQEISISQAAEMIRGQEGTAVILKIKSILGTVRTVRVIRSKFEVSHVIKRVLKDHIGYLKIKGFNRLTGNEVREALNVFAEQRISGILLDLRGCGGGLTTEITKTADYFLPKGRILWLQHYPKGKIDPIRSGDDAICALPMVVLIDSQTQAGELLAAALKTNERAIVLGEKSSGASMMRSLKENSDGTSQKIEVGQYYLDQNTPISGIGVKPDIELDLETMPESRIIRQAISILDK